MPESRSAAVTPPVGAPTLRVDALAAADHDAWSAFLDARPEATIFHSIAWSRIVARTFHHEERHLVARRGDAVVGVLPLFKVSSIFFGTTLISVPFGVYGGIIAADAEAAGALVDAARELGDEVGARYVELRHLDRPEIDLPASSLYVTFIADVPKDAAGCLDRIPRKARAEVRKALQDESLTVHHDGVDLAEFHRLFSLNKRKLGSPLFPSSLFWHIREVLGERAPILSVRRDGELMAAVMSFCDGRTIRPYYSGAAPGSEVHRVNNLMYFRLMEWASERGFEHFDFGRSRIDTGSYAFKKHQGFEPRPLSYDYVLCRQAEVPSLNPSNPRYHLAKKVFGAMPLWMAQKVGSWLVKRAPF